MFCRYQRLTGYKPVKTMHITNQPANTKTRSIVINRVLYGAFVLLCLYYFLTGSYEDAAVNLGIGLIFDPFDQTVRWNDRLRWQRAWLIVHLFVMLGIILLYWDTFGS